MKFRVKIYAFNQVVREEIINAENEDEARKYAEETTLRVMAVEPVVDVHVAIGEVDNYIHVDLGDLTDEIKKFVMERYVDIVVREVLPDELSVNHVETVSIEKSEKTNKLLFRLLRPS